MEAPNARINRVFLLSQHDALVSNRNPGWSFSIIIIPVLLLITNCIYFIFIFLIKFQDRLYESTTQFNEAATSYSFYPRQRRLKSFDKHHTTLPENFIRKTSVNKSRASFQWSYDELIIILLSWREEYIILALLDVSILTTWRNSWRFSANALPSEIYNNDNNDYNYRRKK